MEGDPSDATQIVGITVTDVNELPLAPPPPTVVSGQDNTGTDNEDESTTELKVVWHPLVNTGREDITSYSVEYKKTTETFFGSTNVVHSGTATTARITGLEADTSYQVRVRASNTDDGNNNDGPWSLVGTGSTNKEGNSPPRFTQASPLTLNMSENSSPGQNIGPTVTADDQDARTLSYRFGGRDADLFDFITSSGQIRTKRGVTYNHEDPECGYDVGTPACTYYVTVVASDRASGSDALRVAISVTDRVELPSAPARPTVQPTANTRTSLDVSWSEPTNTGPAIASYTVEYRLKGSSDTFSTDGVLPATVTGTSATISGDVNNGNPWLTAGTSYEVRVRAVSNEGTGNWSPLGTGITNAGNKEPVFRDRNIDETPVGQDATTTRDLNENTQLGRPVGRDVAADDGDGDKRTYKLVAETPNNEASEAAVAKFDINPSTGQILTKDVLDHETEACGYVAANDTPGSTTATTCTYTMKVEVRDGLDENGDKEDTETAADDTITVNITVKDLTESPTVSRVALRSPEDVKRLEVRWYTTNTGPPIINYDLRYRQGSGAWSEENCSTTNSPAITAGTTSCKEIDPDHGSITIEQLEDNTLYSVQVRAQNNEGTSDWSPIVSQRTNRYKEGTTANNEPTFNNQSPTLEVSESHERSSQDVGSVVASDDENDRLTYSLEGPNRNLFTISSSGNSAGQIKTRSGLDYEVAATYVVLVKVEDGGARSIFGVFTIIIQDVEGAAVSAVSAEGDGNDRLGQEPGRDLEGAGEHGTFHHRLRYTVSRRWGRRR